MGLAGSWAAGAVLVDGDEPARFDQVTTGRAAIFTGGQPVRLPDHRDGWRWEPYAVDGTDVEAARQQLQRLMRDAEADIAEALSNEGWLTVLDGPLHGIRHRRGLPVIGYVKTHHRRMLAREHWIRVPELTAGERSGLFAMEDALLWLLPTRGRPRAVGGSLGGHRPPRDAVRHRPRRRGRGGRPGRGLACRASRRRCTRTRGPGEPDADRGPGKAPASPPGRRAPRVARGARGGAPAQPRRTDGMIDDEGTDRWTDREAGQPGLPPPATCHRAPGGGDLRRGRL